MEDAMEGNAEVEQAITGQNRRRSAKQAYGRSPEYHGRGVEKPASEQIHRADGAAHAQLELAREPLANQHIGLVSGAPKAWMSF